jgi:PPK2 family polyphosphate:nucleotide phosphotransferase
MRPARAAVAPCRAAMTGAAMSIDVSPFRVREGRRVDLKRWPTRVKPCYRSDEHYREQLAGHVKTLRRQQSMLYADNQYAVLVILQAMDAAGKDGVIKHVLSGINPQGCQVYSFKHPSAEELDHDFLWRTTRTLPERGRIGVFNRSYYEEVLIVRVHPEILRAEQIPEPLLERGDVWQARFRSIVDFEKHLTRNGTQVVKFFLHISKDEQRKRFLARLDDPDKNWKFSEGDLAERARWRDYMHAYAECLAATSTRRAPWYVVPADDKDNARLIVGQALVDTMERLDLRYPAVDARRRRELQAIRRRLRK